MDLKLEFNKLEKTINKTVIDEYLDLTRPELLELLRADGFTITEPQLRQWSGNGLVKFEQISDEARRFRYSNRDIQQIKEVIILRDLGLSKKKIGDILELRERVFGIIREWHGLKLPQDKYETKKYLEEKGLINKVMRWELLINRFLTEMVIIQQKIKDKIRVLNEFNNSSLWSDDAIKFVQTMKNAMKT